MTFPGWAARGKDFCRAGSIGVLLLVTAPALCAQTVLRPLDDHQLILLLVSRVSVLEAEVRRLRSGTVLAGGQHTVEQRACEPGDKRNVFGPGRFNLHTMGKPPATFSVLPAALIGAEPWNAIGTDPEHVLVQYATSDFIQLSAGRFHNAIGYYNTAYDHDSWLQHTVERPFLFAFEDEGGILPAHNVGLSATGRIPGTAGLHYVAELGNGRTSRLSTDEETQDPMGDHNGESLNFGIYARPALPNGFQAGFSVYRDRLDLAGGMKVGQSIYSGHIVYQGPRLEFLNEMVVLRHGVADGRMFHIPAFYSQLSAPFRKMRPYFRYEYMNVPGGDPLFRDVGLRHGPVAGVRHDFHDFAAFKLEYSRLRSPQAGTVGSHHLASQISFTF